MRGTALHTVGGFSLTEGQSLHSIVILADEFWAVVAEANGTHTLVNRSGVQGPVPAGQMGALVPHGDGGVVLRRLKNGGPVSSYTP